jgi:hypothetical protein
MHGDDRAVGVDEDFGWVGYLLGHRLIPRGDSVTFRGNHRIQPEAYHPLIALFFATLLPSASSELTSRVAQIA